MAWLTANWFWVLIFIAFIAMHLFGHGGHGGRGGGDGKRSKDGREKGAAEGRAVNPGPGGHPH